MRTQEQIETEAEANRRKLVAVEASVLLLLARRRNNAISRVGLARPAATAAAIQRDLTLGIQQARQLSRAAGLSRLQAEVAGVGFRLSVTASTATELMLDLVRAERAAASYARRWLLMATRAKPEQAAAATVSRIEVIAASESADAFNKGRTRAARQAPPTFRLLRVWDSQNDKRRCSRCHEAEGTIVAINEPFPMGEPGSVHPFCRCCWTLLTETERGGKVLIRAAS